MWHTWQTPYCKYSLNWDWTVIKKKCYWFRNSFNIYLNKFKHNTINPSNTIVFYWLSVRHGELQNQKTWVHQSLCAICEIYHLKMSLLRLSSKFVVVLCNSYTVIIMDYNPWPYTEVNVWLYRSTKSGEIFPFSACWSVKWLNLAANYLE